MHVLSNISQRIFILMTIQKSRRPCSWITMFSASSFFAPTYQSSLINRHDQVFLILPFPRLLPLATLLPLELRRRCRAPCLRRPRPLHQPESVQRTTTTLRSRSAAVSLRLPAPQIRIRVCEFLCVLHCSSRILHGFSIASSFDLKEVLNSRGSCFASISDASRSPFLIQRPL